MDAEKSKAPYLGGEEMKPAQETNPGEIILTKEEEAEVAEMVTDGANVMEAKKIVVTKRQGKEEKQA